MNTTPTAPPLIYVAGPFWHKYPCVRAKRWIIHRRYATALCVAGRAAYAPIVYGYELAIADRRLFSSDVWHVLEQRILPTCAELHVLCIGNWTASRGVAREIDLADRYNIPVRHIPPPFCPPPPPQ